VAVDREVVGVDRPAAGVEAHLAANLPLEISLECTQLHWDARAYATGHRATVGRVPAELGDDYVEELVPLGDEPLRIHRPRDFEALLTDEAFEREELLPYWAELWASGVALAWEVSVRSLRGARTLELGCGLALPSIAAARAGGRVTATDWSQEAVELAAANAELNGASVQAEVQSWAEPDALVERAPWDLVLAADVLYERAGVGPLLSLLPRLAPAALLADPDRPAGGAFFEQAERRWSVETHIRGVVRVHRLRLG
jgi:predicted nicotinamide N-methyase